MDDSENVDRLIFFEQYLIKLKSEECFLKKRKITFHREVQFLTQKVFEGAQYHLLDLQMQFGPES